MKPVDKILGADMELGNVIEHASTGALVNDIAARRLLAEIDGMPNGDTHRSAAEAYSQWDPQDWGRKYLTTSGGCAYIDLGHLELCIPEVRSARDFVRYHEASLALARRAHAAASDKLPRGERLLVMANNSDRQGNSWGGHLNVLITRDLYERLFNRMFPDLFVLAAFQVSSILFTGQGKVGAENGKAWVPFQITQRGDFFECIEGTQTTYRRPVVNSRDESHCGQGVAGAQLARLHVIFHDTTLTQVSNYLKAGVTQLVLALMETGWCDQRVMLEHPLEALTAWGHDPDLRTRALLVDGRRLSAIDHQRLFLEPVKRFVQSGEAACVPEAEHIVALWEDTLLRLERCDTAVLSRRLDWVLKRALLVRAIASDPQLNWDSTSIRAADLRFSSIDSNSNGLYAAIAAAGAVDTLVSAADVERAMATPPEDTRAWLRTMVLRHTEKARIERVNWDEIRLRATHTDEDALVIRLDDPRCHGRAQARTLIRIHHEETWQ